MNTHNLLAFLAWWTEELVNALLRPVHRYWIDDMWSARGEVLRRRFFRLLSAADCYPCRVEVYRGQLIINSGQAAEDSAIYEDFEEALQ